MQKTRVPSNFTVFARLKRRVSLGLRISATRTSFKFDLESKKSDFSHGIGFRHCLTQFQLLVTNLIKRINMTYFSRHLCYDRVWEVDIVFP